MGRRRRSEATLTSLSDKGFSLEAERAFEQGDSVRISILPHRGRRAVVVDAIAWSSREQLDRRSGKRQCTLGFMLSDPPDAFTALVDEIRRRETPHVAPTRGEIPRAHPARAATGIEDGEPADAALPRPREPLPPPKPPEGENLPEFRVRVKQVSGPRSRTRRVRALSEREAERVVLSEVGEEWEVLEVKAVSAAPE